MLRAIAERGDHSAFATVFRHFAPRVKAFLVWRGLAAGLAEELTQEVMVNVWRKAGSFDPAKAAVSTWIFTIARNQRIDAVRRARRPEFDPTDPAFVPDEEQPADLRIAEGALRLA